MTNISSDVMYNKKIKDKKANNLKFPVSNIFEAIFPQKKCLLL